MSLKSLIELVVTDTGDKDALMGIASKYPDFGKKLEFAERIESWTKDNWDHEHEMTKDEWRMTNEIQSLRTQLADNSHTGDDMTSEQLNQFIEQEIGKRGLMDRKTFDETLKSQMETKEQEMMRFSSMLLNGAKDAAYFALKYEKDFGKEVDPDALLKGATALTEKRKEQGLPPASVKDYYEQFTAEDRLAQQKAVREKEIADARADERRKTLEEKAMSQEGQFPVDQSGPQLGHFQEKLMRAGQAAQQGDKQDLGNAELGKGLISRVRAREGDRRELMGNVQ